MSTQTYVHNVNAIVKILNLLVMVYVTMKQTMLNASMMVETVVDLLYLVSNVSSKVAVAQNFFSITRVAQNLFE
jgi:hypothetical protein